MKTLYFVVEPAQIVAQDLAHSIRAFDPQGQVRLFSRMADVPAALAEARPTAVFLHRGLDGTSAQRISRTLEQAAVPYAFLGGSAEPESPAALVLASPFNEITVAAMLRRLLGQASDAEDEDA